MIRTVGTEREAFGLIAWLEQTRIKLPLKGVDCRFHVCGDLLSVEIDQVFHQDNDRPLDCVYTFPLPGGAAVYRCEVHINDRVVRAVVEEQAAARRLVQEKKAAGHRTVLVEMERENLFTLSLGNVQPGDLVIVRLAYFQTLTRLQDWTSFQIPFCPGVRYIPGRPLLRSPSGGGVADDTDQVPDASRITPPRIDELYPDAAVLCVEGCVENPGGRVVDLSSPTHPMLVRDAEGRLEISMADQNAVPDRDLVVRWTEALASELHAVGWVTRHGEVSFALVRIQAPSVEPAEGEPDRDIYFLLDRSGSMEGLKWARTAQAFREFVKALKPGDRVWATLFESGFQDYAEEPLGAEAVWADPRVQTLERLGTGGGTELLPALVHVLGKIREHSAGRTAVVVVITDGQVGNEAEILRRLGSFPEVRVHTFGIDAAVNDAFLKQLAAQQSGTCHLFTPNDDLVGSVLRVGSRLRPPVWTRVSPVAPWELARDNPPALHAGEILCLALRGPASAGPVTLRGCGPDGTAQTMGCALQEQALPALRLLWNKQRIDHFLARGDRAAAVAFAKASNLVCEGTAFVAWDGAEKVAVASQEIHQPAMELITLGLLSRRCAEAPRVAERYSFRRVAPSASVFDPIRAELDPSSARSYELWEAELMRYPETAQLYQSLASREPGVLRNLVPVEELREMADARFRIGADPERFWPVTVASFDALCFWILSEAGRSRARWDSLRRFLQALFAAAAGHATRRGLLEQWVRDNLEDRVDYRDRFLAEIRSAHPEWGEPSRKV